MDEFEPPQLEGNSLARPAPLDGEQVAIVVVDGEFLHLPRGVLRHDLEPWLGDGDDEVPVVREPSPVQHVHAVNLLLFVFHATLLSYGFL